MLALEPSQINADLPSTDHGLDSAWRGAPFLSFKARSTSASQPRSSGVIPLWRRSRNGSQPAGTRERCHRSPIAEPIAVVAMRAAAFPGAASVEEFWDLLRAKAAIRSWKFHSIAGTWMTGTTPIPSGRIASLRAGAECSTGSTASTPQFFGISPREAERLDPQQSLLLEVAGRRSRTRRIPPERAARAPRLACSSASDRATTASCQWSRPGRSTTYLGDRQSALLRGEPARLPVRPARPEPGDRHGRARPRSSRCTRALPAACGSRECDRGPRGWGQRDPHAGNRLAARCLQADARARWPLQVVRRARRRIRARRGRARRRAQARLPRRARATAIRILAADPRHRGQPGRPVGGHV